MNTRNQFRNVTCALMLSGVFFAGPASAQQSGGAAAAQPAAAQPPSIQTALANDAAYEKRRYEHCRRQ